MKNIPQIKVYEIDYDFIIKNYLDQSLWNKVWTIFVFKNYKFDLNLERINVRKKVITFDLTLTSDLDIWCNSVSCEIDYSLENMSIDFLKKLIYEKMIRCVISLEDNYIIYEDELYKETTELRDKERDNLEKIAIEFLDSVNVYNEDIRNTYIDAFVDNNETVWKKLLNIKEQKKYTYLSDLYLILAEINDDKELKQDIRNKLTSDKIKEIDNELQEFRDYLETEEYSNDMKLNLEAI